MFWIEHVMTRKKEQVTEDQWDKLKKMFPGHFRKCKTQTEFSPEARTIITQAEGNDEEE